MQTYTTQQARIHLGDLILAAEAGEASVITHYGHPAAVMVSHDFWLRATAVIAHAAVRSSDSATIREGHDRS